MSEPVFIAILLLFDLIIIIFFAMFRKLITSYATTDKVSKKLQASTCSSLKPPK